MSGTHQVDFAQHRFEEVKARLQPFLVQAGYQQDKLTFIPCAAFAGENLVARQDERLKSWWNGQTLIQRLGKPQFSLCCPLSHD